MYLWLALGLFRCWGTFSWRNPCILYFISWVCCHYPDKRDCFFWVTETELGQYFIPIHTVIIKKLFFLIYLWHYPAHTKRTKVVKGRVGQAGLFWLWTYVMMWAIVPQLTRPWLHEHPQSAHLCLREGIQATEETMTLQFNRNPQVQKQQKKATKA